MTNPCTPNNRGPLSPETIETMLSIGRGHGLSLQSVEQAREVFGVDIDALQQCDATVTFGPTEASRKLIEDLSQLR